jgi:hypothetical protein
MKTIKIVFYTLMFAAIFTVSCRKDKDPDIRDQSTGTYNYVMKTYYLSAGVYNDTGLPYSGSFVIKKSDADARTIEFWESEKLSFEATQIEEADNGFTFIVPTQTISMAGIAIPLPMAGHHYFVLNGEKYQGYYEPSGKIIYAALGASFFGQEIIFKITGTKQ